MSDIMTIKEIASLRNVSESTVRRNIAEIGLDPVELRVNTQGKPTPYYELSKYVTFDTLSNIPGDQKIHYINGAAYYEASKTPEGRAAIELKSISLRAEHGDITAEQFNAKLTADPMLRTLLEENVKLQLLIEDKNVQYQKLDAAFDKTMNAYNHAIDRVPDRLLSPEERKYKHKPYLNDIIDAMERRRARR